MKRDKVTIATRGSKLALWQANHIREAIEKEHGATVEILNVKTTGDKILDAPLSKVGGKGLFVKEIEEAILEGRADLAVHSLKDVPTKLPDGLGLTAYTQREDARDALISGDGKGLADLPEGARIGSSSLRRQCQLLKVRPDLLITSLRGNLDTRLRKVEEGRYDAIILAAAGMKRLGWEDRISEFIPADILLPAIGQGALGIECRADDKQVIDLISFLDHHDTSVAVRAERAFLARLEGGCQVPIAAYGEVDGNMLRLRGLVGSLDGKTLIMDEVSGHIEEAASIGTELAELLLDRGAGEILEEVYRMESIG